MRSISIKGVVLGSLLVIALDLIFGVVMMFSMAQPVLQTGMTRADASLALADIAKGSQFLIGSVIFGTLTTVVGGYVAARIAKRLPYLNSAATGVVGLIFTALYASSEYPMWFNIVGLLVVIPASLLGGHLAKSYSGTRA